MSCPESLEQERPREMMEMVSGDTSWNQLGFRIKWTEPSVPGDFSLSLGEPLRLRLAVEAKQDVNEYGEDITAYCWTNIRFKENPCGMWKEVKLFENPKCRCEGQPGCVIRVFQGVLAPAIDDCYKLTFNLKWKRFMVWANEYQVDTLIYVTHNPVAGQMQLNVPVDFSCGHDIAHGDTRCVSVPAPYAHSGDYRPRANQYGGQPEAGEPGTDEIIAGIIEELLSRIGEKDELVIFEPPPEVVHEPQPLPSAPSKIAANQSQKPSATVVKATDSQLKKPESVITAPMKTGASKEAFQGSPLKGSPSVRPKAAAPPPAAKKAVTTAPEDKSSSGWCW